MAGERGEPALVPQWLRTAGGGVPSAANSSNAGASFCADKPSSPCRRSVSSNGIGVERDGAAQSRHYANFGRSNRGRDRRKDGGDGYNDRVDLGKAERLERSSPWQSKYATKRREPDVQGSKANGGSPAGVPCGRCRVRKSSFEKDFPSLVGEERHGDVVWISSPRFISAAHVGTPAIGGEGWTSALVDMPPAVGGGLLVTTSASTLPAPPIVNTGLNMAETLAKAPLRPQSAPQLVDEIQKLEELAIKQSKQLIPVMKPLAASLCEKMKSKARMGEASSTFKATTHASSLPVNQLRGVAKSDPSKPLQGGNFHILNREKNGLSSPVSDVPSSSTCKSACVLGSAPSAPTSMKNPSSQKLKIDETSNLSAVPNALAEKKAALQAKDRNNFFNSLRKKASANSSPSSASSVVSEKRGEQEFIAENASAYSEDHSLLSDTGTDSGLTACSVENGNADGTSGFFEKGERDAADIFDLTKEEKIFLKSLGWDENMGGKPLTAEEINAFLTKYNLISSPKC